VTYALIAIVATLAIFYANLQILDYQKINLLLREKLPEKGFKLSDAIYGELKSQDFFIREIGNVVVRNDQYIFYYTGQNKENSRKNPPFKTSRIHAAVSVDGLHWEKKGIILDYPAEDPFVLYNSSLNSCVMFFEDKSVNPDYFTSMTFSKKDCLNFSGGGVIKGAIKPRYFNKFDANYLSRIEEEFQGWQAYSTSSPVLIKRNNHIEIFYEGIGFLGTGINQGMTGVAKLNPLSLRVSQRSAPQPLIYSDPPNWSEFFFPSDYLSIKHTEVMIVQALKPNYYWSTGLLWKKTNQKYWKMFPNPIFRKPGKSGVMFLPSLDGKCFLFLKEDPKDNSGSTIGIWKTKLPLEIARLQCQDLNQLKKSY
jgi:hypothetical protein